MSSMPVIPETCAVMQHMSTVANVQTSVRKVAVKSRILQREANVIIIMYWDR